MSHSFDYLIEKINNSSFQDSPFKHIYIENFFSDEHFEEIINCPEISIPVCNNDDDLFNELFQAGYKIINFPGCINDIETYKSWRNGVDLKGLNNTATESFGMTLRLYEPESSIITELRNFIGSKEFNNAIALKGGIEIESCTLDNGIQKYLDGYETSPHPDIRRKAATFMVNINPSKNSEDETYHTHYMKFKEDFKFVENFWQNNEEYDRAWVPWEWCETEYQQKKNNSIVLFYPSNKTIHAIKSDYNHLNGQRTQLYGNIWHPEQPMKHAPWEELENINNGSLSLSLKQRLKNSIKKHIKIASNKNGTSLSAKETDNTSTRNY
jgi:hypothetical protein